MSRAASSFLPAAVRSRRVDRRRRRPGRQDDCALLLLSRADPNPRMVTADGVFEVDIPRPNVT